jgi:hypothetical protein
MKETEREMNRIINAPVAKMLRPSINGKNCYRRVPIARKIIGTGQRDSEILINAGIPLSMSDLSCNLITGVCSLNHALASQENYCASFSTTRLLQLLPKSFNRNGITLGIMLYPEDGDGFGHSNIAGMIINMENGDPVKEFHGHPLTVLVKLIESAMIDNML